MNVTILRHTNILKYVDNNLFIFRSRYAFYNWTGENSLLYVRSLRLKMK